MQLNLRKLRYVSRRETKDIVGRGLKLNEEAGELAAEILKYVGEKNTDKTNKEILADLKEEAVDTLIMALDILVHVKASEKEIETLLHKKLDKWLAKLKKKRSRIKL